jgi:hypothetical protein
MLLEVGYDEAARIVNVDVGTPFNGLVVTVEALHVEVAVTDDVASVRTRKVGRFLPWQSG